jgi:hypothetical protein
LSGACLALALAACGQQDAATSVNNAATNGQVEALPPDESAATPSDELANGAAEPQGNTADVEP